MQEDFVSHSLDVGEPERNVVKLEPHSEWRFEVGFDAKLTVRLVDGLAEVFGTELASGREYEFSGQNAAVFTYQGCTLEWEGAASEYVAANATMARYASVHFALESLRHQASNSAAAADANGSGGSGGSGGPRVMIVGAKCSGKSTLAKILASYAVKSGAFPCLVNLDPQNPVLAPPGALMAAVVSHVMDIEYGFGLPPINGPAATHHKQPLVYNYGLHLPATSTRFYDAATANLAAGIDRRLSGDARVRAAGLIVDTPSSFADIDSSEEAERRARAIAALRIDCVLVIGKERLAATLRKLHPQAAVHTVPQSGGVLELSDAFTRQVQRQFISQYFFGTSHLTLSPFTVSTALRDIVVYRPLDNNEAAVEGPDGASAAMLSRVEPSAVLQNCLLAVVNANPTDPVETVQQAETLGYVHVVEADEQRHLLKILLPVPQKVPQKVYIMGEFRYAE